jgi:hypothetical protein
MTPAHRFMLIVTCACAVVSAGGGAARAIDGSSRYLFVWAGDMDRQDSEFLTVLDLQQEDGQYGRVITTVAVGEKGLFPHHTEYELGPTGMLFASGFAGNRTFLFNLAEPRHPTVTQRFSSAKDLSFMHSLARLPNGHVLATMQGHGAENRVPGGLAEIDDTGKIVRTASAADPAARNQDTLRPYSLAVVPALDRIVVGLTPMGIPAWSPMRGTSEHLDHDGDQVQVWRLSDLTVIKTITLAGTASGNPQRAPAEPRVLADGRTVLLATMACGLYRITGLEGRDPGADLVYDPVDTGCAVPVVVGNYWLMPSTSAHGVLSLDTREVTHVREVSRLRLNERQLPHWLATDGTRVAVVNSPAAADHRVWMARVDPATGALSLDGAFRDPGSAEPGVNFNRVAWPHGPTGDAVPHGVVFGQ